MKKNLSIVLILSLFILALFTSTVFGQYDWNPYTGDYGGNSAFDTDYSSPVWTPNTNTGGSSGGSSSRTGGTPSSTSDSGSGCPGTSILDLKNIPDTIQIKVDEYWNIYYIGTTTRITDVYADKSTKKIKYTKNDATVSASAEPEVGEITVCGKTFPYYGYIYRTKYYEAQGTPNPAPSPSPVPVPVSNDLRVPPNRTAVTVNPDTGEVFNACTGALVPGAIFDKSKYEIIPTSNPLASFGTMLTDTKGYVNIDTREIGITCYTWDKQESPGGNFQLFKDVGENHQAAGALAFAVENKWIKKTKKFYPKRKMKMCDLAKIVVNMAQVELEKKFDATFTDVKKSSSYAPYVYTGAKNGWWGPLPGKENKFGCKKNVARGRFAEILANLFGLKEIKNVTPTDSLGPWSLAAVQKVLKTGLMEQARGGKFKAKKSVSRAEVIMSLAGAFGVE